MLKSKKFWNYDACQSMELKQETLDNYKPKGRIYEDINYYYDQMGIGVHTSLKQPYGKDHSDPSIISFINNMVDINTLRILFHILPHTKVLTLKFSTNNFDVNNLEFLINSILNKPNNIYNLIIEWNSRVIIQGSDYEVSEVNEDIQFDEKVCKDINRVQQNLCNLASSPKLEALCLRGNHLGDRAGSMLFENLKSNNVMKVLNLYKNNLTSRCMPSFISMLEVNKRIEEINLGGNYLNDSDFVKIKNILGGSPITNEQLDAYNKKVKDRDLIIEKNKKLKQLKKNEEPVPVLDEFTLIGDVYYSIKNSHLKNINLIKNSFTEKCFESLIFILDYNLNILISMDGSVFTQEQKEILLDPSGKYANRIYLTK
jgi:hypothetical protein